jgi:uncharacterized protein
MALNAEQLPGPLETSHRPAGSVTGPISSRERLEVVDIVRGFALLGILLINITAFKSPGGPPLLGYEGRFIDWLVVQATTVLVESKFFTLFSLLFGLGFAIQLVRAQEQGRAFVPRFIRRLLVLLLFGAAHVVFLWEGDILVIYALVGLLLLGFRASRPQTLLRWASALLALPLLLYSAALITFLIVRTWPEYAAQIQQAEAEFTATIAAARIEGQRLFGGGSYGEILRARLSEYGLTFTLLLTRVPAILGMFLLGLYVGKTGLLEQVARDELLFRRIRFWGIGLGLLTGLAIVAAQTVLGSIGDLVVLFFSQGLAGPLGAIGYGSALVLLAQQQRWRARLQPLATVGRMALTNYLLQSVVCALLFYGYGLGLAGQVAPSGAALLAFAIYGAQVLWSNWWFQHFHFGPLEWIWRMLTYLRWQPIGRAKSEGQLAYPG